MCWDTWQRRQRGKVGNIGKIGKVGKTNKISSFIATAVCPCVPPPTHTSPQAQSQGDAVLVDRLAGQLHVLELQQATLQALQATATEGSLSDLQDELQPLAVLYNEYAAKHRV